MSSTHPDVVVVGAGPAGLSCAITAARLGMRVLLLEALAPGGEAGNLLELHDIPGSPGVGGPDLVGLLLDEALDLGVRLEFVEVSSITRAPEGSWRILGADGDIAASASVVVATGAEVHFNAVAGSRDLLGQGVSTCASCDGPLYKGKVVAVVGTGRDAIHEARVLAGYAERVIVAGAWGGPAEAHWLDTLTKTAGVSILEAAPSLETAARAGGGVVLSGNEAPLEVEVDGVFLATPRIPRTAILGGTQEVRVDGGMRVEAGLYAIGDVRGDTSWTVAGALGDGVTAAWTLWRDRAAG